MIKRGILKEYSRFLDLSKRIFDIIIVVMSAWLAYSIKFGHSQIDLKYWMFLTTGTIITILCFNIFPLYHTWRGTSLLAEYRVVFLSWFFSCLLLMGFCFILKISIWYSREWLSYWFIIGLFLLLIYRFILRRLLRYFRRIGFNQRTVCLISYGGHGEDMYKVIERNPDFGFNIKAVFSDKEKSDFYKDKLLGKIIDSYNWLQNNVVDQLWIAVPFEKFEIVKKFIYEMRHNTLDIRFLPDMNSFNLINHSISEIAGMPAVDLSISPMQEPVNRLFKRCEDIIIGSLILLMVSPVMAIIAIIIKITSEGPIIFKQKRHGWQGNIITVWKFRSMYVHQEHKNNVTQARKNDERVTPFGRFIRKTSLDELPQFINVLQGRMSIVGPRPHAISHNEEYKEQIISYMKRHKVKPGITGWAQINGFRGETKSIEKMQKRIEYDIHYIENWSLSFDIKIILLTIIYGFINKNAY